MVTLFEHRFSDQQPEKEWSRIRS